MVELLLIRILHCNLQRTLAKVNYHIHTDAIKENLIQFHEHTKKGRKTAYIGGQEMFFSFAGSQGEKMAKKTFNSKRPDLSRLKKELIDCAAVRDYVQRQNLPQLHF